MKTMNRTGWISVILLSAVCLWTTGCGGSDGDSGSGTSTEVTQTVPAPGGGTTAAVTNASATPPAQQLVEPQVVSPQSGIEFYTTESTFGVEFQWTAVPGAVAYELSVDGVVYHVNATQKTLTLMTGVHTWSVCGVISRTAGNGPSSSQATFAIQAIGFI
jgi:hypothetical protein